MGKEGRGEGREEIRVGGSTCSRGKTSSKKRRAKEGRTKRMKRRRMEKRKRSHPMCKLKIKIGIKQQHHPHL
jgi:hypothetical protein